MEATAASSLYRLHALLHMFDFGVNFYEWELIHAPTDGTAIRCGIHAYAKYVEYILNGRVAGVVNKVNGMVVYNVDDDDEHWLLIVPEASAMVELGELTSEGSNKDVSRRSVESGVGFWLHQIVVSLMYLDPVIQIIVIIL
ncbi:hypothetical protein EW146_g7603 [Bondarzewia mesenterica]|uniref:Uncharacterized protein n=1 Tax=Bondarzewia mesenterica TaxID=1095465 RepID=A0A4S4LKX8_9AGAM|nr:hypothetical protein EW146_g7603 [Bondarzewia mesenterica]